LYFLTIAQAFIKIYCLRGQHKNNFGSAFHGY
jgi:hypothetical protein